MDITFIGHNAMYFGTVGGLLIDPVLEKKYGDDYTSSPVEIYPPRDVDYETLPAPSAIVISHEHSDHFQIASLSKLSRDATVYVGPLMPDAVRELVTALGFGLIEAEFGRPYEAGDVLFQLYPAGRQTALWESRVSQIYVRDLGDPEFGGAFITVDALPSEMFVEDVRAGSIPPPVLLGCSNNAQVTPAGVYGSTDNMQNERTFEGAGQRSAIPGADIVGSLFDDVIAEFPEFAQSNLLLTGGGFLKDYEEMGPFPLSDQDEIASAVSDLVDSIQVLGPRPGDRFRVETGQLTTLDEPAKWVRLDTSRWVELQSRRDAFLGSGGFIPMKAILQAVDAVDVDRVIADVESDFLYLERLLLTSSLARELLTASAERGRAEDVVLFRLLNGKDTYDWSFDLAASKFLRVDEKIGRNTLHHYPFGIVAHLSDWHAVITGRFQIWDIVGVAMRAWFPEGYGSSPVICLYNGYGEQARPEIAYQVYREQLSKVVVQ
ncbi:MAG: MBL fold metallo-hydrolase [Mycobacterium sp.]|nr:MBL fold metallo-hydrolase [Mycobacterium sp.]